MKKSSIVFLAFISVLITKGQDTIKVDFGGVSNPPMQNFFFEDNSKNNFFYCDSTESNNLWQIGHPAKSYFTNGYSSSRALVTDSANPYPINNTSTFYTTIQHSGIGWTDVSFMYKINSDTISDGGTIEISLDGGTIWYNIAATSTLSGINWYSQNLYTINDTITSLGKPGVSGTLGWKQCGISVFLPNPMTSIFKLKFSFASDGIGNTTKDGWVVDNFLVNANMEGVNEYFSKNEICVFPNPTNNNINYVSSSKIYGQLDIIIYDTLGKKVLETTGSGKGLINVSDLKSGIYFATFKNKNIYETKKISVQK